MILSFSVITPSYCQGRFIRRTIDSVLAQNDNKDIIIDYLICDGASNDETVDILREYGNRVRWLSEPDNGQADAVNKGISMTQGDIIAWLNSDDIYYPDAFSKVKQIFDRYPEVQAIYGDADHIDEFDRILEPYPTEPWDFDRLKNVCFLCQPATFFRRSLVEQLGPLDAQLNFCMDYELWLRYGQHIDFYYLPEKLAGSRFYASNKTLGQRVSVHYEINEMLKRKFHRVPDKWLFNYVHNQLEHTLHIHLNKIDDPSTQFRVVHLMAYLTVRAFLKWNHSISAPAALIIISWLLSAYKSWLEFHLKHLFT